MHAYLQAYERHAAAAKRAYVLFAEMCAWPMPRVPGMDTVIRLAWRIECGRTVQEAATKEYLYRWNLAVKAGDQLNERGYAPSIFGTPHTIGM